MAFNRNLTNDPNRMKRVVLFLMAIKILTISAGLCNLSACKIGTKERTDTQRFCFKQRILPTPILLERLSILNVMTITMFR